MFDGEGYAWPKVVQRVRQQLDYRQRFQAVFGAEPTRDAIAKAIACYERTSQAASNATRWIAGRADDERAPVWEWVQLAENFVATQAVLYVSQFFVQLRNLLLSVTVGTLLLLLAATSYPFQPQSLLVVYLLVMVGVVTVGTVSVLVQINRNPFVSRLSNTTPERFTPDWAFLSSFGTYVLPLLGVLAVQLSGSFRTWLEPVFRILK
jgi:hypothetical protein